MIEQVGFVGVGNQGGPIAMRIARAGIPLHVWARRPEVLGEYTAAGATAAASLADLGERSDLVAVCVTSDADVRAVVLGSGGLLGAMRSGSSLAVHSTVHPNLVRELAEVAAEGGVTVLDAPVSGGHAGAVAGTMAVLVGGDPAVLERWMPVMDTYAKTVELLGPVGAGQTTKLLNNALSASNLAASVRAVAAAEQLGLNRDAFRRCVQGSSGDSFMLRASSMMDVAGAGLAAARYRKDIDLFHEFVDATGIPDGAQLAKTAEDAVRHLEGLVPPGAAT